MIEHAPAELRTVEGEDVLRLERRFPHTVEKVWRAVTDTAELARWFPAEIDMEPRPGAAMRFTFPGDEDGGTGEVLELDAPHVFAFRWDVDIIRIALFREGPECRMVFTQTLRGGPLARLAAARNAFGWEVCLAELEAGLDGGGTAPPSDRLGPVEGYIERFGLAEGRVVPTESGHEVRFTRDLQWHPLDLAWSTAAGDAEPRAGGAPPAAFVTPAVPAGEVTEADAPRSLEYTWLHDGAPAGTVRWDFAFDPGLGSRVELVQTVPARLWSLLPGVLASWQTHFELYFAAVNGDVRCPWPADRAEALTKMYAARLA